MGYFPNRTILKRTDNKYRPNLVSLMTLCANNYMLLLKVLAKKEKLGEKRHFFINDFLSYTISVNEITRYTSLISIEQTEAKTAQKFTSQMINAVLRPYMSIRLYHDAQMAEVISTQNIRQVKPRYDYPNKDMHQQDEKQQTNQFLNEWLHLCLELGQVNVTLPKK